MAEEVPECLQADVTFDLIPPNEWLDEMSDICPVCASLIGTYMSHNPQAQKLQHQLWHYIIASRVLPKE